MIRINLLTEGRGGKRPGATGPRPAMPAGEGAPPYVLFAAIILLAIVGTAAYGGWLMVKNRGLAIQIAQQKEELKKYEGAREKVAELEKKKAEYSSKLDQIKQLKDQQSVPVKLMNRLVEVIPEGAWYTSVRQNAMAINVEGRAKGIKTISTLYDNLVNTVEFSGVQLGDVQQQGGADDVYSYKLTFNYNPSGVKPKEAEAPKPPPPTRRPRASEDSGGE
jgi:Tfp pilus assembly protein PilN